MSVCHELPCGARFLHRKYAENPFPPPADTPVPGGFPTPFLRFIQQDSHNQLLTFQQKCFGMSVCHELPCGARFLHRKYAENATKVFWYERLPRIALWGSFFTIIRLRTPLRYIMCCQPYIMCCQPYITNTITDECTSLRYIMSCRLLCLFLSCCTGSSIVSAALANTALNVRFFWGTEIGPLPKPFFLRSTYRSLSCFRRRSCFPVPPQSINDWGTNVAFQKFLMLRVLIIIRNVVSQYVVFRLVEK
jgi:hypothetical protein